MTLVTILNQGNSGNHKEPTMTATTWDFDLSHSSVNFSVRHLMVSKVHGRFQTWGGTLVIDNDDITRSRVSVEIDAASIDTKEEKRDAHLRSADFFDAENHPKLIFKSTAVKRVSDDELEVTGDLTIRGTTKPVVLKVESNGTVKDPWGGIRAGFSAKATILRKEFGLHWNALLETGGVVVGDKIEIGLEIEAIQRAANQAA
jgi:polyisoprenoid-binding protein YceI